MSAAKLLLDRLGRHYVKPSKGGGLFVTEIGTNDWNAAGSRCDAVYIGFTSASGKLMVGHEVKCTRADWLHELDQPGKADFWHDNTHAWYVVAPGPGIVKPEELPHGWGLMLPNPRSDVRMDIVVKAAVRQAQPSWQAVRSVIARYETGLRAEAVQRVAELEAERLRVAAEKREQQRLANLERAGLAEEQRLAGVLLQVRTRLADRQVFTGPDDDELIEALCDVVELRRRTQQLQMDLAHRAYLLEGCLEPLATPLAQLRALHDVAAEALAR